MNERSQLRHQRRRHVSCTPRRPSGKSETPFGQLPVMLVAAGSNSGSGGSGGGGSGGGPAEAARAVDGYADGGEGSARRRPRTRRRMIAQTDAIARYCARVARIEPADDLSKSRFDECLAYGQACVTVITLIIIVRRVPGTRTGFVYTQ